MTLRRLASDQRGTTITELLVGVTIGGLVMFGLTTLVVVTMHSTSRTSTRADATQRARIALNRVIDQLHSACVAPKTPPVRPFSTPTSLRFVHASGTAAQPVPVLSVISLTGTTLTQSDYAWKEGIAPSWTFDETTPIKTTELLTHVSPISPTKPVFSYYSSAAGSKSEISLPSNPLSQADADRTTQVGVAFMAHPGGGPATEAATPARMRGGATFRLTTVSYNAAAQAVPCA